MLNQEIKKQTNFQKKVFTQQLRNVMSSAQEEALGFIRRQSALIAKDLTKEHRRFVASYKYLKDTTEE